MIGLLPVVAEASKAADNSWLIMCAAILMAIFVIMNMRRRRPSDGSPKQHRSEIDSANSQSLAIKRSLEKLLIELEELSRKIHGQIDTKFSKLDQSIVDADKRISALRILLDEAKRVIGQNPETHGGNAVDSTAPEASSGTLSTLGSEPSSKRDTPIREPDERHWQIYNLADRGRTPVQIAQELGTTTGEVELILNLRASDE